MPQYFAAPHLWAFWKERHGYNTDIEDTLNKNKWHQEHLYPQHSERKTYTRAKQTLFIVYLT